MCFQSSSVRCFLGEPFMKKYLKYDSFGNQWAEVQQWGSTHITLLGKTWNFQVPNGKRCYRYSCLELRISLSSQIKTLTIRNLLQICFHINVKTQCYIILTLQPFPALEQTIAQLECNTKQANLTGNTVKPLLSSHPRELARWPFNRCFLNLRK